MTHAGAGRIPAALTHRQQSSDRAANARSKSSRSVGVAASISRAICSATYRSICSFCSKQALKKPQAARESGAWGSSSANTRRASRCAAGTSSDPAAIGCTSSCHFPIRVARWHPSKGATENSTRSARNVSTAKAAIAVPSTRDSIPCRASFACTSAAWLGGTRYPPAGAVTASAGCTRSRYGTFQICGVRGS